MDPSAAERLLALLRSLPPYSGTVFRGAAEPPAGLTVGAPLPASKDPRVATENFAAPVVVAILTSSARDLGGVSRHPEDGEVVLLPGTTLEVAAQSASGGLVVLEEVTDAEPARLDQVLADLTVTLDVARAAAETEIRSPGKYVSR